jgi:chemotaxis response regulator CheB
MVVAATARMRRDLRVALASDDLELVAVVGADSPALSRASAHQPHVVVVEAEFAAGRWGTFLASLRDAAPKCVVMAAVREGANGLAEAREARAGGADDAAVCDESEASNAAFLARVRACTEPRSTSKSEPKSEVKSEPKGELRTESNRESRVEPKIEGKVEPKVEPRSEPKSEPKVELKSESKSESKSDGPSEPKPESKSKPRPERKLAPSALEAATAGATAPALPRRASPLESTSVRTGRPTRLECVAIGVSTGGPNALAVLLPALPADFPLPIVLVQHMPPIFTSNLAQSLRGVSKLRIREAAEGDVLEPGLVLIAPGDFHMALKRREHSAQVILHRGEPENFCRPAVDVLFRSVAELYGAGALAVVLTGMGQDGMLGAQRIRAAGGQVLAQDEASSVVWGMPGAVARAGLADAVLPLENLAAEVLRRSLLLRLAKGA